MHRQGTISTCSDVMAIHVEIYMSRYHCALCWAVLGCHDIRVKLQRQFPWRRFWKSWCRSGFRYFQYTSFAAAAKLLLLPLVYIYIYKR